MLCVEYARWDQTPADLRELAMSASHPRTRERFLALYEITQESCATRVAAQARRHPQTVMEWLHLYNTRGPEALVYQHTGGRPPSPSRRSHGGQRGSGTNPLSRPKPPKAVADRPAFTRGSFRSHHHSMRSGATVAHPPRPRWHLHPRPALGMRQPTPNSEEPLKVVCVRNFLSLDPAV